MIYPDAVWRPLPENATQPKITPTQVILHTAVDAPGPTSLFPYFVRGEVRAESHFFVRLDGTVEQYIDTTVMANANRRADVRAISIETEDDGRPEEIPWSQPQLAAIVKLVDWLCVTHKIPRVVCPAWDKPGIGWHSMWGFRDPIAQTGPVDNPWSSFRGKTCPGKTRIRQFVTVLMPALQTPPPTPTPAEVDPAMFSLVYVQAWDHWYLSGPAGVARIADWNKVTFWRDINKIPLAMLDPKSFEMVCSPKLLAGVL